MNIKQQLKSSVFSLVSVAILAGNAHAQSMDIPTVAVVKGGTAEIRLDFVAGGGSQNFDFTMSYNPAVVDEDDPGFAVSCQPANVGLDTLPCTIDKTKNEIRGIGVNNPLDVLITGEFAVITLPVRSDAPEGENVVDFAANFAAGPGAADVQGYAATWTPKVNLSYCNQQTFTSPAETSNDAVFDEACVTLLVESSYSVGTDTPETNKPVYLSSGLQIQLLPGFAVEQGVELNASVCGQSLCSASDTPMPDGCHSCVVHICDADVDPSCCTDAYTQSCVDKVNSVCGLVCQ